jgi:hypothetical protein
MNPSQLALTAFDSHVMDLRRQARTDRAIAPRRRATSGSVAIRLAGRDDEVALARLAVLDDAEAPTGTTLLAEVDGRVVAALPLDGGRAIADPFEPTADVVHLLELRAAQLRETGADRSRSRTMRALAAALPVHGLRRAA